MSGDSKVFGTRVAFPVRENGYEKLRNPAVRGSEVGGNVSRLFEQGEEALIGEGGADIVF